MCISLLCIRVSLRCGDSPACLSIRSGHCTALGICCCHLCAFRHRLLLCLRRQCGFRSAVTTIRDSAL